MKNSQKEQPFIVRVSDRLKYSLIRYVMIMSLFVMIATVMGWNVKRVLIIVSAGLIIYIVVYCYLKIKNRLHRQVFVIDEAGVQIRNCLFKWESIKEVSEEMVGQSLWVCVKLKNGRMNGMSISDYFLFALPKKRIIQAVSVFSNERVAYCTYFQHHTLKDILLH